MSRPDEIDAAERVWRLLAVMARDGDVPSEEVASEILTPEVLEDANKLSLMVGAMSGIAGGLVMQLCQAKGYDPQAYVAMAAVQSMAFMHADGEGG